MFFSVKLSLRNMFSVTLPHKDGVTWYCLNTVMLNYHFSLWSSTDLKQIDISLGAFFLTLILVAMVEVAAKTSTRWAVWLHMMLHFWLMVCLNDTLFFYESDILLAQVFYVFKCLYLAWSDMVCSVVLSHCLNKSLFSECTNLLYD